jgi:hypothetical protein
MRQTSRQGGMYRAIVAILFVMLLGVPLLASA